MDAFFASVELLRYPELCGQAVVVGGRSTHQPVEQPDGMTTSTYEARALGVFSGMGLMKSAQLAPDAILLPVNFDAYRHYSRLFKAAVATIASTLISAKSTMRPYTLLSGSRPPCSMPRG